VVAQEKRQLQIAQFGKDHLQARQRIESSNA